MDKFLVPYKEKDDIETLELVEPHTRNNTLEINPEPEKKELEDQERKKHFEYEKRREEALKSIKIEGG